ASPVRFAVYGSQAPPKIELSQTRLKMSINPGEFPMPVSDFGAMPQSFVGEAPQLARGSNPTRSICHRCVGQALGLR
ncbi:MAG: hypothetical protein ACI8PT_004754, partial [Gammaproteobacteria bacterium]